MNAGAVLDQAPRAPIRGSLAVHMYPQFWCIQYSFLYTYCPLQKDTHGQQKKRGWWLLGMHGEIPPCLTGGISKSKSARIYFAVINHKLQTLI